MSSDNFEQDQINEKPPMNGYEKLGRFTVGAFEGGLGGAIGAVIAWKVFGIHFEAPIEQVFITAPAVTIGLGNISEGN